MYINVIDELDIFRSDLYRLFFSRVRPRIDSWNFIIFIESVNTLSWQN